MLLRARNWWREAVVFSCIAGVFIALAMAKLASIRSGPSAGEAIVAMRLAERELVQARRINSGSGERNLTEAHKTLKHAWALLNDRRYGRAVETARRVILLARDSGG